MCKYGQVVSLALYLPWLQLRDLVTLTAYLDYCRVSYTVGFNYFQEPVAYSVAVVVNHSLKMSTGKVAKNVAQAMMGLCRMLGGSRNLFILEEYGIWKNLG